MFASSSASGSRDFIIENDLFKIEFDFPTPRPHFIILENRVNQVKKSILDLGENEINSLLNLIQTFINRFALSTEKLVLSFHIGYWVLKNN